MVSINYAFKEIISKIVYYGPGLSGKTTNLQHVFKKVPKETRGELISLATDADRTLYFDFLPVNVGNIRGFQVKFQLYTVPGQVYYNATRKLVLRGVDGLVFVADSQIDKMDENIESLRNLEENLTEYGYSLDEIPFVIQYNKRDLPNIATIEELQAQLNSRDVPYFEAVATTGSGVFGTLKAISKIVIDRAQKSGSEKSETKAPAAGAVEPPAAKPKPQPVAASVRHDQEPVAEMPQSSSAVSPEYSSPTGEDTSDIGRDDIRTSESQPAYGELPEEAVEEPVKAETNEETGDAASDIAEKPAIVKDSETLTNVVVSTDVAADESEEAEDEPPKEDIEETTEHAVLKDDTNGGDNKPVRPHRHHPDVLDADKLEYLTSRAPRPDLRIREEQVKEQDETVVSDPRQLGQVFSKPQMAESVKVKGKKKAGLFGWLKKKN